MNFAETLIHDYYESMDYFCQHSNNVTYGKLKGIMNAFVMQTIQCKSACMRKNTTYQNYGRALGNIDKGVHTWIMDTIIPDNGVVIGISGLRKYYFNLSNFEQRNVKNRDVNGKNTIYCLVFNTIRNTLALSTKKDLSRQSLWFDTTVIRNIEPDNSYRLMAILYNDKCKVKICDYYFRKV